MYIKEVDAFLRAHIDYKRSNVCKKPFNLICGAYTNFAHEQLKFIIKYPDIQRIDLIHVSLLGRAKLPK